MLEYDRLSQILQILSEKKSSSVRELAHTLYVSDATIRRDLNVLERQGNVRRVFGGVILLESNQKELPFYGTTTLESSKEEIALKAVERISNGDVIMLDASGTTMAIIPHLKRFKGLTIITNSAITVGGLQDLDARVYITGGYMPRHSQGFVGNYAEAMLRNYNVDTLFFCCSALSPDGMVSVATNEDTSIRRVMMQQAKKRILLCDHTKFGRKELFNLCSLSEVDELISDQPYTGKYKEKQLL